MNENLKIETDRLLLRRQKYKCLSTGDIVDEEITALLKEEWLHSDYPNIIVDE